MAFGLAQPAKCSMTRLSKPPACWRAPGRVEHRGAPDHAPALGVRRLRRRFRLGRVVLGPRSVRLGWFRCFGGCLKIKWPALFPGRHCACPGLVHRRPVGAARPAEHPPLARRLRRPAEKPQPPASSFELPASNPVARTPCSMPQAPCFQSSARVTKQELPGRVEAAHSGRLGARVQRHLAILGLRRSSRTQRGLPWVAWRRRAFSRPSRAATNPG